MSTTSMPTRRDSSSRFARARASRTTSLLARAAGQGRTLSAGTGRWSASGVLCCRQNLLRIGVQFADGRTATNIGGHDRPVGGPSHCCLGWWWGRRRQRRERFRQGYWISPLPPPGPVGLVCEWPAVEIPVVRQEIDAQLILDAAERARAMFGDGHHVLRDGRAWRLGTDADAAWINDGTSAGPRSRPRSRRSSLPTAPWNCRKANERDGADPARAGGDRAAHRADPEQPWWLGYLDTGASDVVFPYAPRTTIYYGYGYVLVEAGPQQAAGWRDEGLSWALPELMFPARPLMAGLDHVGRRLDFHRRIRAARGRLSERCHAWAESQTRGPRTGFDTAGSRDELTNPTPVLVGITELGLPGSPPGLR